MNFHGQPFWWLLTAAVLAWYATVTVWVAVKGLRDIRGMLRRLRATGGGPRIGAEDEESGGS